jgi:5-methylcytosine-specific restriction endonuclease McrA
MKRKGGWSHNLTQRQLQDLKDGRLKYPKTNKILGSAYRPQDFKYIILKYGLKENKCEWCGLTQWNGKLISMQLHHKVRAKPKNDRLDNILFLCPNCHFQHEHPTNPERLEIISPISEI